MRCFGDESHHKSNESGFKFPEYWDIEREGLISSDTLMTIGGELFLFLTYGISIPDENDLPLLNPNFYFHEDVLNDNEQKERIHCTWIGHATAYIQMEPSNICFITDPVFSDRASSSQWIGPRRIREPPCEISDLPKVDFVLISHNHYDHLDFNACEELQDNFEPTFFVPKGVKEYFNFGFNEEKIIELDWWEESTFFFEEKESFLEVHCLPSQHFSNRSFHDVDKSLWSSWGVKVFDNESKNQRSSIFFAGDTGYNDIIFKEIRERFGPVDFSLIPIGAYMPRKLTQTLHFNPEDAVKCSLDLESRINVAIHWGTFLLTFEKVLDPVNDLKSELEKLDGIENLIDDYCFEIHSHGETKVYEL